MKIVLFSYHYFESKRKANFHHTAEALWKLGHEITFVTTPISWLHKLGGNFRFQYPVVAEAGKLKPVRERLFSFVWFTWFHPVPHSKAWLNALMAPLYGRYPMFPFGKLERTIRAADCFIFESSAALMFFEKVKQVNPRAKMVYRVSDDLELIDAHPGVIRCEKRILPKFDLVSVPCEYLRDKFSFLPTIQLDYFAIDKELFDPECPSPFVREKNMVFIGHYRQFDRHFLTTAASAFPEVDFHIIGDLQDLPVATNVFAHGVMPFLETVPFLKHADAGLATFRYVRGIEVLSDSLKIIQYTYCKLPYITADFMKTSRENAVFYHPDDEPTIQKAVREALDFDRSKLDSSSVSEWIDVAKALLP